MSNSAPAPTPTSATASRTIASTIDMTGWASRMTEVMIAGSRGSEIRHHMAVFGETLRLLKEIVTFTPSSRKTRSSGRGRKSGTTSRSPWGSSVYRIFSLIDSLSFAPVSSTKDPDNSVTVCEAHSQDTSVHAAKTVIPLLFGAMFQVLGNDAL